MWNLGRKEVSGADVCNIQESVGGRAQAEPVADGLGGQVQSRKYWGGSLQTNGWDQFQCLTHLESTSRGKCLGI